MYFTFYFLVIQCVDLVVILYLSVIREFLCQHAVPVTYDISDYRISIYSVPKSPGKIFHVNIVRSSKLSKDNIVPIF